MDVVDHPAKSLMGEVKAEREISSTPEARALQEAILQAVRAYWDYLERHGLHYDETRDLVRASALHVVCDFDSVDIFLKDGAIDRRYRGGDDPDPFYSGRNPTWPKSGPPSSKP